MIILCVCPELGTGPAYCGTTTRYLGIKQIINKAAPTPAAVLVAITVHTVAHGRIADEINSWFRRGFNKRAANSNSYKCQGYFEFLHDVNISG